MRLFLIMLFVSNSAIAFAQSKIDNSLAEFIRNHNYVQLTDTAHLPSNILPYLPAIKEHLSSSKYAAIPDVYVEIAFVRDTPNTLTVPIIDLIGIKSIKQEYDTAPKAKDIVINGNTFETLPPMSLGNPAGRERELEINKADSHITTYITQ